MDGDIIPRTLIVDRARRAVESGQPIHQFNAWPVGTAAGRAFIAEVLAQQAMQQASRRVAEGIHA